MKEHKLSYSKLLDDFKSSFKLLDYSKTTYQKWSDFVFLASAALRNSVKNINPFYYSQSIEDEYLNIINQYAKPDQTRICELLGIFILLAESAEPKDILGEIFMDLGLSDSWKGQFFTPNSLSQMMAKMKLFNLKNVIEKEGFITVSDPACGAGSTLMAVVNEFIEKGIDPAKHLFVHAQDIDRTAALMCFIQLTLWNVPAIVIVGDTLKNTVREEWFTPSYIFNSFRFKEKKSKVYVDERNFILIGEPY
ncbi:N-6 DNA methylase [Acinetobacter baumannii]|uniref:N-6 DNA methylase n=1 Tax=Acinetobacter baumannii TaxID=470 RepID=UPI0023426C30|nr:N-6 DNA methylase [Acinetobacter baumannii]